MDQSHPEGGTAVRKMGVLTMVLSARALSFPEPAVPADPRQPLLDLAHLARQTMGNETRDREMLLLFRRQARQILRQLDAHEERIDPSLKSMMSALKGAANVIGARALASRIEHFEQASQRNGRNDLNDLPEAATELRETLHATIEAIDQIFDESSVRS